MIDVVASLRSHLLVLARARIQARRARVGYRDVSGTETERDVDVFGLSFQDGFWYAFVHCHLRHAVRMLRVDRLIAARVLTRAARTRPPSGFDAQFFASVEYLHPGTPVAHLASIRLERPFIGAAAALFPSAVLEREGRALLCHVRVSALDVLAALVTSLDEGARLVAPGPDARQVVSRRPSRA